MEIEGVGWSVVLGEAHRRGCMRARYDHLDLPLEGVVRSLWELASPRGVRLACSEEGSCVVLSDELVGLKIRICPAGSVMLSCTAGEGYLMKTRAGRVYVGGVKVAHNRPY